MMYRLHFSRDLSVTENGSLQRLPGRSDVVGVMKFGSLERPKKKFVLKIFHLQNNGYTKKRAYL